jgi:hypothetical protein
LVLFTKVASSSTFDCEGGKRGRCIGGRFKRETVTETFILLRLTFVFFATGCASAILYLEGGGGVHIRKQTIKGGGRFKGKDKCLVTGVAVRAGRGATGN